jgi:hypothetical protein
MSPSATTPMNDIPGQPPCRRAHYQSFGKLRLAEAAHARDRIIGATARALDTWRDGRACQLCGSEGPLSVALLRVARTDERTRVKACTSCSVIAWRTVERPVEPIPPVPRLPLPPAVVAFIEARREATA